MTHYFGAHYDSSCPTLIDSAKQIQKAGGNLIQIFLTLPGSKETQKRNMDGLIEFKNYLIKNNMKVVVHSSYLHNIGRKFDKYSYWIQNIMLEIEYCHVIGADCLVLHFGKQLKLTLEETYNNMYTSLIYIHNNTSHFEDVIIAMETSSGQGTESLVTLNDLAYFYKKFSNNPNQSIRNRIKLCLDTCHIFQAGMNKLENKNDVKKFLEEFDEKIGIQHIKLVHLNNCKFKFNSHRDVHASIFAGTISENALKHFFKFFRKMNVDIVLETSNTGHKREIDMMIKDK